MSYQCRSSCYALSDDNRKKYINSSDLDIDYDNGRQGTDDHDIYILTVETTRL